MGLAVDNSSLYKLSLSPKVSAIETSLQQCISNIKDISNSLQQLDTETEKYRIELMVQKEKCDNKSCIGAESLKKVIETKDGIIQAVASMATKLNETKDFTLINEIFKVICGDTHAINNNIEKEQQVLIKTENITQHNSPPENLNILDVKNELSDSVEDASFKEESISEIEGTPTTGRISPIIQSKRSKSSNSITSSTESRDKKKCPETWLTPNSKLIKLSRTSSKKSTGSGKLKQARLMFENVKPTSIIDLTSSPEFSRGTRSETMCNVKPLIKKESSENDDTILPSPTSGPTNTIMSIITTKENVNKFKKPLSLSRKADVKVNEGSQILKEEDVKMEELNSPVLPVPIKKPFLDAEISEMENSINILQPNRFQKSLKTSPKRWSPMKVDAVDDDVTHCEEASISILNHVPKMENFEKGSSPTKRPLVENINITNVASAQSNVDDSVSVLQQDPKISTTQDNAKRKTPEKVEPLYKEPLPRKKADKLALPAWLCDECKDVIADLYSGDAEKAARVVARCSKHRGRSNPARPKTPPGFWHPRWDVPEDTEEFNRRNNAV